MTARPNVLILFTDQQRHDTVAAAGYSHMITPNLDNLCREGCTFVNAHSASPVCMPARHDFMTGLPARAHGYFANLDRPIRDYSLPTLARIFTENGYRTVAIGKCHHYPARMHHGFGEMYTMGELIEHRQDDDYAGYLEKEGLGHLNNIHGVRPHIYHIPQTAQMDEKHHGSTWVASRAIEWLEENGDSPFFAFLGWVHPHPPWDIPESLQGLYAGRDLPDPVPISRTYPDPAEPSEWFGDFDSPELKRKTREAYYSAITLVDKNVGRILDYLRATDMLDNTLVIFTSDHGEMLYDKGYFSKELPYEGSVRVPLIVRYPERFGRGEVRTEFVDHYDCLPTCLDVCGLEYPSDAYELPGESLCSAGATRDRSHMASACGIGVRRWVMCRNRRYKYVYFYNQGHEELYDMSEDPGEMHNLMESGDFPREVRSDLRGRAFRYEAEWGPEESVKDGDLAVLQGTEDHGSVRGKFHFWCNMQMPYFDRRSNEERGREFVREMVRALQNREHSVVGLDEVFNDPLWRESFLENWRKFGSGDDIAKLLFRA